METFIITRNWIFDNRTERGAWNKKQLNSIGIKWPAKQGWIDEITGTEISSHNARNFEEYAKVAKNKKPATNTKTIDSCIQFLFNNVGKMDPRQLVLLRNIESKYLDLSKRK